MSRCTSQTLNHSIPRSACLHQRTDCESKNLNKTHWHTKFLNSFSGSLLHSPEVFPRASILWCALQNVGPLSLNTMLVPYHQSSSVEIEWPGLSAPSTNPTHLFPQISLTDIFVKYISPSFCPTLSLLTLLNGLHNAL